MTKWHTKITTKYINKQNTNINIKILKHLIEMKPEYITFYSNINKKYNSISMLMSTKITLKILILKAVCDLKSHIKLILKMLCKTKYE